VLNIYPSFWVLGAFGSNGTTKPKLQNRYGAADQNIQTFIASLGYL
jgi:hypothetical protein